MFSLLTLSLSVCFPMDKLPVRIHYRKAMAAAAEYQGFSATAMVHIGVHNVYARRLLEWNKGITDDEFDACSFDVENGDVQMEEFDNTMENRIKAIKELNDMFDRMDAPSDTELDDEDE